MNYFRGQTRFQLTELGYPLIDVVACRMVGARPLPHSLKTNFNEHRIKYVELRFEKAIENFVCCPQCLKT